MPTCDRLAVQARTAQVVRASAALGRRRAQAHLRSAKLIAAAHDLRHTGRILRASKRTERARRCGMHLAAPAWFAVVGLVDDEVVRAVFDHGRLACDRPLEARARALVDLGEVIVSDDPPRSFRASLQAPPIAVALTLARACDRILRVDLDVRRATAR